jgi:regulatory protein YycI of two-component signal transduction system YycFG
MQWGHIKTLFILSFLLLNIYLISAFFDRQQEVSYLDNQELPIEDQLASEDISYEEAVDEVDITELVYISVGQLEIADEELDNLETQTAEVLQDNVIISELEDPIPLDEEMAGEEIETMVLPHVLYGMEYSFWGWNETFNIVVFFQQKEDRTIYYNENGLLLGFLNEDNELTHYTQTVLGETEVEGDLVQLNQPIQVIGQLFNANYLNRGDEVTNLDVGYYSRIAAEGIQVFAPTWNVGINQNENHLVNAIEGIIYENNADGFLLETLENHAIRLSILDEDHELRESFSPHLEERLEVDENRSESE